MNYSVGYGKPPVHTRFQPGQSGNPKERQKGRKNNATLLNEALDTTVQYTENGIPKKATKRKIGINKLATNFAKGDPAAIKVIMAHMAEQDARAAEQEQKRNALRQNDRDIIDDFISKVQR